MGFKQVKTKVLECLKTGHILHEERDSIDIKNLLSTGVVSVEEVMEIIGRARGNDYSSSPHHFDDKIDVHVINTTCLGRSWYIKWYFTEPDSVFISIHY
jgi:hypothetical protein